MWKPGKSKPAAISTDNIDMDTSETKEAKEQLQGMDTKITSEKTPPSSKSSLSGATMNMRFMQRKSEQKQQEQRRRSTGESRAVDEAVSPNRPQHNDGDGDDDDDDDDMSDDDEETTEFQVAGSADLYGPQANVLGRRSFGGFNRPMEDAWKASHHQSDSLGRNSKAKVSDDELLKRYEDYVKNGRRREDATRPIGNLQNKQKRRGKSMSAADVKRAKRPA
jgi:hypothetical protein